MDREEAALIGYFSLNAMVVFVVVVVFVGCYCYCYSSLSLSHTHTHIISLSSSPFIDSVEPQCLCPGNSPMQRCDVCHSTPHHIGSSTSHYIIFTQHHISTPPIPIPDIHGACTHTTRARAHTHTHTHTQLPHDKHILIHWHHHHIKLHRTTSLHVTSLIFIPH